jgi:tRNA threonylcarbamoyladenosine biosynthesis protein TsaB
MNSILSASPTVLALESSTEHCSVALAVGEKMYVQRVQGVRRHAEHILPMVDQVLAQAGLFKKAIELIAFGRGPGAFTGVRLAVAIAQGLAFALDRRTIGISCLEATAQQALTLKLGSVPKRVVSVLDARMGEVYAASFDVEQTMLKASSDELVAAPLDAVRELSLEAVSDPDTLWVGSGLALLRAQGLQPLRVLEQAEPDAETIARMAQRADFAARAGDAYSAQPSYVRDRVAETIAERAAKAKLKALASG